MVRRKTLLWTVVAVVALYAALSEFWHHHRYGDFYAYGPHIDIVSRDLDLGFPGVRKVYAAKLANYGLLPITFDRIPNNDYLGLACDGFTYHTRIERRTSDGWQPIDERSPSSQQLYVYKRTLVLGRSICAPGWVPIGAIKGIMAGDHVRLVIFNRFGQGGKTFTSREFVVSEQRAALGLQLPSMAETP